MGRVRLCHSLARWGNRRQLRSQGLAVARKSLDFWATGDLGYLDDDGDLWIVQRRTDLIVTGGENVYPSEVERVLRGLTAVYAACVIGIDSPEWGQTVAAMVQLHPDATVTEAELLTYCRQQLAGYKLPRHIQFVNALPQTASGKIARAEVQKQLTINKLTANN